MATAKDIYNKLIKDPDLEINTGQTREQAAEIEANYRARQYQNNVKALALATDSSSVKSSLKALITHVSNLNKTFSTTENLFLLDVLKELEETKYGTYIGSYDEAKEENIANVSANKNSQYLFSSQSALYKRFKKLTPEGQAFFQSLVTDTSLNKTQIEHIFATIMGPKPKIEADVEETLSTPKNIYNAMDYLLTEPNAASAIGLTGTHISEMQQAWKNHPKLKTIAPSPKPFKPNSIHADGNYGDNKKSNLATPATLATVNAALKKLDLKSLGLDGAQIKFGSTNKVKLVGPDDSDFPHLFNPLSETGVTTSGRLYTSYVDGKNPASHLADNITTTNLSDYSVADIINAIVHLTNQETPSQTAAANSIKHETEKEVLESQQAAVNYIAENKASMATVPINHEENKTKGHTAFGTWGHVKHGGTKDQIQLWNEKDFNTYTKAFGMGMQYGIINQKGQLNKIGQVLLNDLYDKGFINKAHVINFPTHAVLMPKGIELLLDHHEITTPELAEQVATEILMNNSNEILSDIIDEPTADWDEIAKQIAVDIPPEGADKTSDTVIESAIDNIEEKTGQRVSRHPKKPADVNTNTHYKNMIQDFATKLAAAYESEDADMIKLAHANLNMQLQNIHALKASKTATANKITLQDIADVHGLTEEELVNSLPSSQDMVNIIADTNFHSDTVKETALKELSNQIKSSPETTLMEEIGQGIDTARLSETFRTLANDFSVRTENHPAVAPTNIEAFLETPEWESIGNHLHAAAVSHPNHKNSKIEGYNLGSEGANDYYKSLQHVNQAISEIFTAVELSADKFDEDGQSMAIDHSDILDALNVSASKTNLFTADFDSGHLSNKIMPMIAHGIIEKTIDNFALDTKDYLIDADDPDAIQKAPPRLELSKDAYNSALAIIETSDIAGHYFEDASSEGLGNYDRHVDALSNNYEKMWNHIYNNMMDSVTKGEGADFNLLHPFVVNHFLLPKGTNNKGIEDIDELPATITGFYTKENARESDMASAPVILSLIHI